MDGAPECIRKQEKEMQKAEVLNALRKIGLVPVLRAENEEQALALASAVAAGGVNVLEVTMTVPGAIPRDAPPGRGAARHSDRRGHRAGRRDGAAVHSGGRGVCGQSGAQPEDHRDVPSLRRAGASGRADADRDPHRVGGGRGRGQGLPGKRAGRGEVPEVDQGAAAPGGAGAHRRRIAGHRGGVSGGGSLRARRRRRPGGHRRPSGRVTPRRLPKTHGST